MDSKRNQLTKELKDTIRKNKVVKLSSVKTQKVVEQNPKLLSKRISVFVAKIDKNRLMVGFTTERKPSDLEFLDVETLLLAKINYSTAGYIQDKMMQVFKTQYNAEVSETMVSSYIFDFKDNEYLDALDCIYLLIANEQKKNLNKK